MKLQSIFGAMILTFSASAAQASEVPDILSSVSDHSVRLITAEQAKKIRGEHITFTVGDFVLSVEIECQNCTVTASGYDTFEHHLHDDGTLHVAR